MSAKVLWFNGETKLPIPCDRVLNGAVGKLKECVLVGLDNDGKLYIASSEPYLPDILWLLERARKEVLRHE